MLRLLQMKDYPFSEWDKKQIKKLKREKRRKKMADEEMEISEPATETPIVEPTTEAPTIVEQEENEDVETAGKVSEPEPSTQGEDKRIEKDEGEREIEEIEKAGTSRAREEDVEEDEEEDRTTIIYNQDSHLLYYFLPVMPWMKALLIEDSSFVSWIFSRFSNVRVLSQNFPRVLKFARRTIVYNNEADPSPSKSYNKVTFVLLDILYKATIRLVLLKEMKKKKDEEKGSREAFVEHSSTIAEHSAMIIEQPRQEGTPQPNLSIPTIVES